MEAQRLIAERPDLRLERFGFFGSRTRARKLALNENRYGGSLQDHLFGLDPASHDLECKLPLCSLRWREPGAHSTAQPALALQDDSGCPASEPIADTACACAASSKQPHHAGVARNRHLATPWCWFCGPGVYTPAPTLHLPSPRWRAAGTGNRERLLPCLVIGSGRRPLPAGILAGKQAHVESATLPPSLRNRRLCCQRQHRGQAHHRDPRPDASSATALPARCAPPLSRLMIQVHSIRPSRYASRCSRSSRRRAVQRSSSGPRGRLLPCLESTALYFCIPWFARMCCNVVLAARVRICTSECDAKTIAARFRS